MQEWVKGDPLYHSLKSQILSFTIMDLDGMRGREYYEVIDILFVKKGELDKEQRHHRSALFPGDFQSMGLLPISLNLHTLSDKSHVIKKNSCASRVHNNPLRRAHPRHTDLKS